MVKTHLFKTKLKMCLTFSMLSLAEFMCCSDGQEIQGRERGDAPDDAHWNRTPVARVWTLALVHGVHALPGGLPRHPTSLSFSALWWLFFL